MAVTVFQVNAWCEEGISFSSLGETGEEFVRLIFQDSDVCKLEFVGETKPPLGLLIPGRLQVGNNVVKALRSLAGKDTDNVIVLNGFAINHNPPLTLHETSASVAVRRGIVHGYLRSACTCTTSFYNFMNYLTISLGCMGKSHGS
jgi:hypothetical protein